MSVFRKRGFDAHKEEEERRKKENANRVGKLWRYFLSDEDEDVPLRFLTEEPVLFYEHSIPQPGGKYSNETCTGDDCVHCESGNKPSYKGAWLVVDGREREVDEYKDNKKTGKTKIIKDQIKLYVRGATDIAKLDRLSRKFGLTTRPWFATKTGKNTSTSYELDRGEPSKLTTKEIKNLLSKAPEKYREIYDGDEEVLYNIVEHNVFDDVELVGSEDEKPTKNRKPSRDEEEDEDEDLDDGVSSVDDDEEEEKPKKKPLSKKPLAKKSTETKKKSVFKRK